MRSRGALRIDNKLIVAVLAALLAGLVLGGQFLAGKGASQAPKDTSPEAGFARDMMDHHSQAVEMSFIIRDNTSDQSVRTMAFDIINTQSVQIGMMKGWLGLWGLPQTGSRPAMSWMRENQTFAMGTDSQGGGMDMDMTMEATGRMPGMATDAELQQLRDLKDKAAEILYLQLMIRHHKGGIGMAKAVLATAKQPEVRNLAQTIVNGQQTEIEAMQQMLQQRGAGV